LEGAASLQAAVVELASNSLKSHFDPSPPAESLRERERESERERERTKEREEIVTDGQRIDAVNPEPAERAKQQMQDRGSFILTKVFVSATTAPTILLHHPYIHIGSLPSLIPLAHNRHLAHARIPSVLSLPITHAPCAVVF
jgi:hypothetical protein